MPTRSIVPPAILAAILFAIPSTPTFAGEVYGRVTLKGTSVGDGASVAARCAKGSYPARPTDKSGRYHLVVGESGNCTLTVTFQGQSADLAMVSYEDDVQVDIDLD